MFLFCFFGRKLLEHWVFFCFKCTIVSNAFVNVTTPPALPNKLHYNRIAKPVAATGHGSAVQYTNAKLLCLNRYLNGNVLGKTAVGICSLECLLQWEMGRTVSECVCLWVCVAG